MSGNVLKNRKIEYKQQKLSTQQTIAPMYLYNDKL